MSIVRHREGVHRGSGEPSGTSGASGGIGRHREASGGIRRHREEATKIRSNNSMTISLYNS